VTHGNDDDDNNCGGGDDCDDEFKKTELKMYKNIVC
jgi:hypothetical protein